GQAFALLEGNRLFKIRVPLPDSRDDPFIPPSLMQVAEQMKSRYRTPKPGGRKATGWVTTRSARPPRQRA
uniref:hypothetical protein n=1 Tax=Klebsiella oxytoca TaxID=571 RepID=UPI00195489CB